MRSSSGSRHSEMYFSEVDVAEKSPVINYNYIRSSEDISSGYSSAEPISGVGGVGSGLSRTSSMTNATRPRFKAKRAEDDDIYIKFDQYTTSKELSSIPLTFSNNYPSKILFCDNYHYNQYNDDDDHDNRHDRQKLTLPFLIDNESNKENSTIGTNVFQSISLNDLKDEIFLKNENFFQNSSISKNTDIHSKINRPNTNDMNKSSIDNMKENHHEIENIPENMKEKYQIFCKWLELMSSKDNDNMMEKQILTVVDQEPEQKQQEDTEEYKDANKFIENDEEEEIFLDTETETNIDENINEINRNSLLNVETNSNDLEKCIKSNLLNDEINSLNKSDSNLDKSVEQSKKILFHNKGKAPDPPLESHMKSLDKNDTLLQLSTSVSLLSDLSLSSPSSTSLPSSSSSSSSVQTSKLINSESNSSNLIQVPNTSSSIHSISSIDSRSSSPSLLQTKSADMKKLKKNIFKNYLPSLFRSESTKLINTNCTTNSIIINSSTTSSDISLSSECSNTNNNNYLPKETQI